jgi:hypothetical protein
VAASLLLKALSSRNAKTGLTNLEVSSSVPGELEADGSKLSKLEAYCSRCSRQRLISVGLESQLSAPELWMLGISILHLWELP